MATLTVQVGEADAIAEAIAEDSLSEFLTDCARQVMDDAGFAYAELSYSVAPDSESITFSGDIERITVIRDMLSTAPDCHVGNITDW